jgi:hypothetical protein
MDRAEWDSLFPVLEANLATIQSWPPSPPDPAALRCEDSRHRTLAHLRACQEQWLLVAEAFLERDHPRVTILHPWRHFEAARYDLEPWESHLEKFAEDRRKWLGLQEADWNRAGTWNRKSDTIGGLTKRLASHEAGHLRLLR